MRGELLRLSAGQGGQHSWAQLGEPLQAMLKQELGCSSCQASVPGGLKDVWSQAHVPPLLPLVMLLVMACMSREQHPAYRVAPSPKSPAASSGQQAS